MPRYPQASNTADIIVEVKKGLLPYVLLIERKGRPFVGKLALPGGFWQPGETLEETASRELKEETGLIIYPDKLTQFKTYSDPDRDPRGPVISTVFFVKLSPPFPKIKANDDAASAKFFSALMIGAGEPIAFDHQNILIEYLSQKELHER